MGDDDDEDSKKKRMSRPFGVAFAVAGGAGGESAMSVLQDRYAKSMTLREAEDLGAEILKQVMEQKIGVENCEFALLSAKTQKFEKYDKAKIEEVLARLPQEDH